MPDTDTMLTPTPPHEVENLFLHLTDDEIRTSEVRRLAQCL